MIPGKRIRLRAPSPADVPLWTDWLNDPEVTAHLSMPGPIGQEDQSRWLNRMTGDDSVRLFTVEYKDHSKWVMIGHCNYQDIDWRNRNAEVGFFLGNKSYWNQGVGAETASLLLKFGFEQMQLHRIWLRVYQTNKRAIRAYEKAGFTQEAVQRAARFKDGKYISMVLMSILYPEWRDHNHPLA
jgi:RimJ/RimL family protein N-acetyltransferase